jgi:hypothetical protein
VLWLPVGGCGVGVGVLMRAVWCVWGCCLGVERWWDGALLGPEGAARGGWCPWWLGHGGSCTAAVVVVCGAWLWSGLFFEKCIVDASIL